MGCHEALWSTCPAKAGEPTRISAAPWSGLARGVEDDRRMQYPQLLDLRVRGFAVCLFRVPRERLYRGYGEDGSMPGDAALVGAHVSYAGDVATSNTGTEMD